MEAFSEEHGECNDEESENPEQNQKTLYADHRRNSYCVTNTRLSGCSTVFPSTQQYIPQIKFRSAITSLLKCNWGIGLISIPHMLSEGGVIGGVFLFCLCMGLTQFSVYRLIKSKEKVERGGESVVLVGEMNDMSTSLDYTGIIATILGTPFEYTALLAVTLSMWGSCIGYFKFIHDNIPPYTPSADISGNIWVVLACIFVAILAWFDSLKFLQPAILLGLACAITFSIILITDTALHVSPSEFRDFMQNSTVLNWKNIPITLSISMFCNEGIVVLAPSAHSALREHQNHLPLASATALILFTLAYMVVGVASTVRYRKEYIRDDITESFNPRSRVDRIAVALYAAQLLPTFAVVYFCSYEAIEEKFCRSKGVDRGSYEWKQKYKFKAVGCRLVFILIAAAISVSISSFVDILSLVGALGTSIVVLILPHLAWLRLNYLERSIWRILPSCVCIIFGIALAIGGSIQSIYNLVN